MPFFEVKQEILQKQDEQLLMRFFMDTKNNANLHIWSDMKGNIDSFQLSNPGRLIEWKKGKGFFTANVDEGDDKVGVKASSIVQLNITKNQKMVKNFIYILESALKLQQKAPFASILAFVLNKIQSRD